MTWSIAFHDKFACEFAAYPDALRLEILAILDLLQEEGPALGRPHVDTLNGSHHKNMKEIRCRGVFKAWRIAFIFTPERKALLLAAGNKSRTKSKRFYDSLIKTADTRFDSSLKETINQASSARDNAGRV